MKRVLISLALLSSIAFAFNVGTITKEKNNLMQAEQKEREKKLSLYAGGTGLTGILGNIFHEESPAVKAAYINNFKSETVPLIQSKLRSHIYSKKNKKSNLRSSVNEICHINTKKFYVSKYREPYSFFYAYQQVSVDFLAKSVFPIFYNDVYMAECNNFVTKHMNRNFNAGFTSSSGAKLTFSADQYCSAAYEYFDNHNIKDSNRRSDLIYFISTAVKSDKNFEDRNVQKIYDYFRIRSASLETAFLEDPLSFFAFIANHDLLRNRNVVKLLNGIAKRDFNAINKFLDKQNKMAGKEGLAWSYMCSIQDEFSFNDRKFKKIEERYNQKQKDLKVAKENYLDQKDLKKLNTMKSRFLKRLKKRGLDTKENIKCVENAKTVNELKYDCLFK